jgi:hypothetical protein
MTNEIRPEDVRRIAAAKEREVLGEEGIRRFADPTLDLTRGEGPPRTPYGTQGHGAPAAQPRAAAPRGPYDRNPRAAFDRPAAPVAPPPLYPGRAAAPPAFQAAAQQPPAYQQPAYQTPVYERPPLAADPAGRDEATDDDLGMPPAYAATYGGDEEAYEALPARRRRALPMAVAAIALVGFGALVWYAYDWGTSGSVTGAAPVIEAQAGPDKVKPTEEGGIEVPNQEATVLNPGASQPKTEVLMPPPEEPVTPPPPAPPAPSAVTTAPTPEQPAVVLSPAPAATQPAGTQPAAAPPSPPPATAVAATQPSVPAAGGGATIAAGDFLIQLASLTSPEAAQKAWGGLQKKHPGLLGDMTVSIQEADIAGKGKYYRVQAGPLPNRATADDMCAQLKAAKQDCIVVKR